eukprot:Opistho-2@41073
MNSHTSEDRSSAGSSRPVKSSMRSDSGVRVRSQNSARFDDNVGVIPPKSPDSDGGEARDEATEHEMFERMRSMQKEILETQGPEDAAVQDAGRQSVLSEFSDVDFFEDSEPTSESEGEDDNERYNELKILEKYTHPATGVVSTMSTEAQRADRKRNMELIRQMENADNDLREKQRAVESCNDELALTKSAFNSLREEANRLSHELRDASGADAIPAVKEQRVRRLQAALDKCLAQMAMQESAVGRAEDALRVADADVSRAELARMHLTSISEEARAVLEQYEQENVVLARVRAAKEAEFDRSQARRRRRHEAKVAAAWREQEERIIRAMEAARDGHRKATERLETTPSTSSMHFGALNPARSTTFTCLLCHRKRPSSLRFSRFAPTRAGSPCVLAAWACNRPSQLSPATAFLTWAMCSWVTPHTRPSPCVTHLPLRSHIASFLTARRVQGSAQTWDCLPNHQRCYLEWMKSTSTLILGFRLCDGPA